MWALVESYPCLSFHGVIVVCLLHIISGNTPTLPLNRGLASEPSARGSVEIRPSSVAMVIISALSNRSSVSCFERPNERSNERLASAVERADERNNGPENVPCTRPYGHRRRREQHSGIRGNKETKHTAKHLYDFHRQDFQEPGKWWEPVQEAVVGHLVSRDEPAAHAKYRNCP